MKSSLFILVCVYVQRKRLDVEMIEIESGPTANMAGAGRSSREVRENNGVRCGQTGQPPGRFDNLSVPLRTNMKQMFTGTQ